MFIDRPDITIDNSVFSGLLNIGDTTVQKAFETVDQLSMTSTKLRNIITDEVGSGYLVFNNSPTFVNNISVPIIKPSADSISGVVFTKANGLTPVLFIDTLNSNLLDKDGNLFPTQAQVKSAAITYALIFG